MQTMRVQICKCDSGMGGKLTLHRQGRIHQVWSAKIRTEFFYRLLRASSSERRNRRNHRKKCRIIDYILLLDHTIVAIGRKKTCDVEALIKHSKAAADHGLRL